jgi:hypothetical protein
MVSGQKVGLENKIYDLKFNPSNTLTLILTKGYYDGHSFNMQPRSK